jgi:imidazolonepropionase-like amidohydrolase
MIRLAINSRLCKTVLALLGCFAPVLLQAQETFPVNGVAEPKSGHYALVHATVVKDGNTTLNDAAIIVKNGKVIQVGTNLSIPKDAMVIDCKGKYIYPSFIDVYSDYGIATPQRQGGFNFNQPPQLATNVKGAYGWNQALKPEVDAFKIFSVDDSKAATLREQGFGVVLTHQKDGIARGTGAVVTLANEKENLVVLKEKASAHYSLNKGTSTQSYPSSLMGTIALLRQTYLDAQWFKSNPSAEGVNITLASFNANQSLPQIFEANDKWNDIRADRIGDEFGVQYIIKGGGNEYQRIKEIAATKATYILPLNYPQAMDVEDPNDARFISLTDMKHWELAPTNPAAFEKANIPFVLTAADLRDAKSFMGNLRKAIEYGLTEAKALEALTKAPAQLLGVYDKVGSIENGKLANFIVTNGPLFNEKSYILENWVQGRKYEVKNDLSEVKGNYNLVFNNGSKFTLEVKNPSSANIISGKDTIAAKLSYDGKLVKLNFAPSKKSKFSNRLSGVSNGKTWSGTGVDSAGKSFFWTADYVSAVTEKTDSAKKKEPLALGKVVYPFTGYGVEEMAKQENLLIRNATVWTNEAEGKIEGADVLVKNGKIAQVGKNLKDASARVIDGTGKHLTAGIIDEHSHIAAASINEGGQSVTSEVRIQDNLDPEDIDIYRQLSGGVTTSHILHGSANTIGGQTQLIKLRWGADDKGLMFAGADPFIKFALGENVKRTFYAANNRYPDTRMGVQQVLMDAFQRAKEYEVKLKQAEANNKKKGATPMVVRRDLELDALVEIMNKKRFITMHSYVQSEITAAMRVAEKYGFNINTFTHILEGYKVADKMKAHGANASTFSDWWMYKNEVVDAIPYNATIMHKVGLNVAINSDDAEMARRLNQEAAKSVKYGGMSEEDALKMVTLNPAKMLHIDDRVGSIKVGKDADLVLWSNHPLSIYAKAEKTIVDGAVYFDREKDAEMRVKVSEERNRLIQKLLNEKKSGAPVGPGAASMRRVNACSDHQHNHGLLVEESTEF